MALKQSNLHISILHPQIKVVGGAMKQMLLLAELLSKNHIVSFYSFEGNQEIQSQNHSFSIHDSFSLYPMKILSFFIIAWKIRHDDIIICGNSPTHFVAGISKIFFRSKAKTIWWNHHYPWYYEKNTGITTYFKKLIETLIVSKIDTIVGNSRFLQTELQTIFSREIDFIYPMIDGVFFEEEITQKQRTHKPVLFTAGRWEDGKGLSDIFHIYEVLSKKYSFDIYIAGVGMEISAYIEKYSDTKNIHFLGQLSSEEMKKHYLLADAFLFPSKIDSFGLVLMESLISGTPVIAYDNGEAKYIIENEENGYIVEDLKEFTEKVKYFLNTDIGTSHISQKTKKSFISNYSMKHFEKQWETIIFEK